MFEIVLGSNLCLNTETKYLALDLALRVEYVCLALSPHNLQVLTNTWIPFVTSHSVASAIFADNSPGSLPVRLVLRLGLCTHKWSTWPCSRPRRSRILGLGLVS